MASEFHVRKNKGRLAPSAIHFDDKPPVSLA